MRLRWPLLGCLLAVAAGSAGAAAAGAAATAASVDKVVANAWLPQGYGYDWSRAGFSGQAPGSAKIYNVKGYGAAGNGIKRDDAAVKAALRAASTNGGGVVYFPRGNYLLTQPLFLNSSNLVLRGAGLGQTKLVFSRSLSDVYGMQWGVDNCTGAPKALWSSGGAMILLSGRDRRSAYFQDNPSAQLLTNVVATQTIPPGATRLRVNSIKHIKVGQWVYLVLNDDSTAPKPLEECEFRNENDRRRLLGPAANSSRSSMQVQQVPSSLYRDANIQMAMETGAAEGDRSTITSDQAAALDAERRQAGTGGGVVVPSVDDSGAAPGSIAAWVYGENRAFSGGPGAINPNSMRFAFKVTKVEKINGRSFIESDRDIILAIKPGWNATIQRYVPGVQRSGIEDLTISFKNAGRYAGHFTERGYNAIAFDQATQSWVRRVKVENADNALFVYGSEFVQVSDFTVDTGDRAQGNDRNVNGHHAISVAATSQSCLVTRFNVARRYVHDTTVSGTAKLNVYSKGRAQDLNMDHHRAGPYANLFSDISTGANTRPFHSGGRSDRGAHTGRGATFWNIRPGAANGAIELPECDFGALVSFVLKTYTGPRCTSQLWKVMTWQNNMPVDLHLGQVKLRQAEQARRRRIAA